LQKLLSALNKFRSYFIIAGLLITISCFVSCTKNDITLQWVQLNSGTSQDLNAVWFSNSDTGYVAGGTRYVSSVIVNSPNSGSNWELQSSPSPKALYGIYFRNTKYGFACGYDGKILRTYDGGNSWSLYQTFWAPLREFCFLSDSIGYVVGGNGYDFGLIEKTTDGGNSWQLLDTFKNEFRGVAFTDNQTGYVSGYGTIQKTNNGGQTWFPLNVKGDFFMDIAFPNPNVGYLCGYAGSILKTSDAGNTWQTLRNGNDLLIKTYNFYKIKFFDLYTGYVIGDNGIMMRTMDGGANWSVVQNAPATNLRDIFLTGPTSGYIVGTGGAIYQFTM
jgi:photosystem II stability/assembly factor-like uncharacterized protein